MNETMLELDRPGLGVLGSCSLGKCCNTLAVSMKKYGNDIRDRVIDLDQWFELFAARHEDHQKVLVYQNTNS